MIIHRSFCGKQSDQNIFLKCSFDVKKITYTQHKWNGKKCDNLTAEKLDYNLISISNANNVTALHMRYVLSLLNVVKTK